MFTAVDALFSVSKLITFEDAITRFRAGHLGIWCAAWIAAVLTYAASEPLPAWIFDPVCAAYFAGRFLFKATGDDRGTLFRATLCGLIGIQALRERRAAIGP